MRKHKLIIILASFLIAMGVGAAIIYAASGEDTSTVSTLPDEAVSVEEPANTEEEKPEAEEAAAEAEEEDSSITETVQRVLEGAIDLFVKEDLHITAIGDSLTQGVGDETDNGGYVGILSHSFEELDQRVKIDNFGKRGNRSDQMLERLDDPVISASVENADVVLITIGANDIMKVTKDHFTNLDYSAYAAEEPKYQERLQQIFDKIDELNPDARVYLIGFYNPFEDYFPELEDQLGTIISEFNAISKNTAEENDQSYIPVADLFENQTKLLLSEDYFHPNEQGYEKMAERILEEITPDIEAEDNDEEG